MSVPGFRLGSTNRFRLSSGVATIVFDCVAYFNEVCHMRVDECKTYLSFEFISQAILSILYPYSCKNNNISSKFDFVGFLMESK